MVKPRRFDAPLATQGKTIRLGPGKYTVEIARQGMSQSEIVSRFKRSGSPWGFNAKALMRALLWEEIWACEDGKTRPRKDVRGFLFYEIMAPTFVKVMQLTWTDSLDSMMGDVWAEALEANPDVPALLNVYSEKEGLYDVRAEVGNAYPNVLVAVEKADWFDELNIANIYGFSFCCTGGQKSSIAALEFLSELKRRKIDLSDGLTIFSMYDLDPAGWQIPENLRAFLQRYISGKVKLVRLGLLPGAYDESGMALRAKPYTSNAETVQAEKAANTTWEKFVEQTGGVYLSDGTPAVVELGTISAEYIKEDILDGLAKHLNGYQWQKDELTGYIEESYKGCRKEALDRLTDDWWECIPTNPRWAEIRLERECLELDVAGIAVPWEAEIAPLREELKGWESERDLLIDGEMESWDEAIDELKNELAEEIEALEREYEEKIWETNNEYEAEIAQLRGKYGGYIAPIAAKIEGLETGRDDATIDKRLELGGLEDEEDELYESEWAERRDARNHFERALRLKDAGDVLDHIEKMGWRDWLKKVGIDELDLSKAARNGDEPIDYKVSWDDMSKMNKWLTKVIASEYQGD